MKIVYIVLKGMPLGGGVEKYTEEIGARLAEKGHEVIVYTMRHYGAKDGFYKGMSIKTIPTLRTKSFEKLIASFLATLKLCIEDKVDIVHFHAFGPAMFCFIPRLLGKKVIVQGHGLEWKRSRWGMIGKLFLKISEIPSVKFCNKLAVVSKVQQNYVREKYKVESEYIPTGVNLPTIVKPELIKEEYGLNGNDYILFASRLVREKGAHYLIEAYNRLKTNIKLVIAGDAEHEERYKAELHELVKGNKNIIFTGFVTGKKLHELFSNCYFFVQPSEVEGLPIALLEAMSYGNCCLASDIEENIEALQKYGYVFKSMNIDSLTEILGRLLSDYSLVKCKKNEVSKYVLENYSWDNIAVKFENLYNKTIAL